ncbi:MAG: DUF4304 domain-containing protein [Sphingobacteriales bacterium]
MIEKTDIINFLNSIFIPIGFKRKGNNWVHNGDIITKMVNLQGSNYGNYFYLNYGFIIRKLQPTTHMHVFYRLGANTVEGNRRITDLLDIGSNISIEVRFSELRSLVSEQIVTKFQVVNNDEELLEGIKKLPTLNILPLIVKDYFHLPH